MMPDIAKYLIRNLELFAPNICFNANREAVLHKTTPIDFPIEQYSHFPAVIDDKGIPWPPANLYLLSKLENINIPNAKTLESIANDLVVFKRFLTQKDIEYDHFPKRKLNRPTYLYRAYLVTQVREGQISVNTAKRKISSIVGFYRWLQHQTSFNIKYPAWSESERFISFQDEYGFTQSKSIKQTDLSLKLLPPKYTEGINDGGKLKPLNKSEQQQLAIALKAIGNIEMTLMFLIALTSGARIQTVCTLRLNILNSHQYHTGLFVVHTGGNTLIDTKLNKPITLVIPEWVVIKLKVYANSIRAKNRRSLSKHYQDDFQSQYIFLTKTGKPYYVSGKDPKITNYNQPPKGDAIRQFIKTSLSKQLANKFSFRFHDLRATFGLNLVEEFLSRLDCGEISRLDLLMLVKERMAHSRLETTEGYLNYRVHNKLIVKTQSEYELFLKGLIDD
ncbi:site-specific integrase [Pseudoalteromonas aliena]|uniref:site-specific integrase n=1 Tax=Pseudoalteromonas aliena TaxID=247523 RepID=UPI00311E286B